MPARTRGDVRRERPEDVEAMVAGHDQAAEGALSIAREITLREYAERWLATIAADRAPRTHRGYAERLKRHVLPALGHLKLRLIHRVNIKALLTEKRRQGTPRTACAS